MPITKTSTVADVLTTISVDMLAGTMACTFQETIDGVPSKQNSITITGADFAALLATQAAVGQSLADEITIAIYNYASSKGLIPGVVS
jgi:hypothetical protein